MYNNRKTILILLLFSLPLTCLSQDGWQGKKCAVALTYDDALNVHLDNVVPLLDSVGLKGTFYLSAYFPGCQKRIDDWRKVAQHGHELGNHTLFHPCIGNTKGREWVGAERDLSRYTTDRLMDEIIMTNVFLQALDGKTTRTFAYPCGDTLVQNASFVQKLKDHFVSARGVKGEMSAINNKNLYMIGSYMINGQTGDEMIGLVKEAMKKNALVVFLFHGVGGEHGLNVGLKEHRQLIQFLKEHNDEIWTAPFMEITEFMKEKKM